MLIFSTLSLEICFPPCSQCCNAKCCYNRPPVTEKCLESSADSVVFQTKTNETLAGRVHPKKLTFKMSTLKNSGSGRKRSFPFEIGPFLRGHSLVFGGVGLYLDPLRLHPSRTYIFIGLSCLSTPTTKVHLQRVIQVQLDHPDKLF